MPTTKRPRPPKTQDDPEFVALITTVETVLAEWSGPGPLRPHGVAHQDPSTRLLTWHLRGLPEQLDHILAALRAAEPAEVRLARVLADIAAPATWQSDARSPARQALIWAALSLAHEVGLSAGVDHDPTDPRLIVAYIELPTGRVSWHLPG
ncbi:hypothetical protein OOJ91_33590 [Micromonospora lupini]|uniref:hypothetical protein n=1 Tax=Micromonospora lupini TaxID=285679 RepID=UPI002255EEE5|nr:hypothetical protein [Micromonospora lupini]MCX5070780.1 hypothetical protein [Micromonospora lupini]